MPSTVPPDSSSYNIGHGAGLLYALNSAAAQIQRSARSEADIFHAFHEQITKIDLHGSINLLSEDGKFLTLVVAAIDQEKLDRFRGIEVDETSSEWASDVNSIRFTFPFSASDYLSKIMEADHSTFEPSISRYLSEIIPDEYGSLADQIIELFGSSPGIFSPLIINGKIHGLLTVDGPGITADDLPTVEAFANHIVIALQNAHLFAQMQSQVSERIHAEEALRESEQKYRSIVRQSSDGIILGDEEGKIIEWNEAQERITGYTQAQVLGSFIWDIQFQLSPNSVSEEFKQITIQGTKEFLAQGRSPWMVDTHVHDIRRSDGELCTVQVAIFPLPTDKGYRICSIIRDISDRIDMERVLRKRANELAVLQTLSLHLTQVHDLPTLMSNIVDKAVQLLGAKGGSLYLCEPEHELVRLYVEQMEESFEYIGYTMKYGEGAAGQVVLTGEPLIIDDYRIWQGRTKVYDNIKPYTAVLTVPMIWQGEVTGVLQVLDDMNFRGFNQADQELLILFANHAAVALETTRLLDAERRRRQEAETLVKASAALTSTLEVDQLLKVILTHLENVVPYDSASVFLLEGDRLHIVAAQGFPDGIEVEGRFVPLKQDQLFMEIQRSKHSIVLDDVQKEVRFNAWGGVQHVRGWLGVPLIVQGQVIGCLTLDNQQPGIYHAGHVALAEAFANQAATAIEKSHLFQAERDARESAEALRDAARVISSTLSLNQVLETVLEQLARVLAFDSGNVMLLEDDYAIVKIWYGYQEAAFRTLVSPIRFKLSPDNAVGCVVGTAQPIMLAKVRDDPRWQDTVLSQHIQSWLGVPLLVRGRVIGLFNLDRVTDGGFCDDEIALVQTFASHAAVAIDNARMFETEERRAAELEALHHASLSLTSSLEFVEVLDSILDSVAKLLPDVSDGYIFLFSEENGGQLKYGASLYADGSRAEHSVEQSLRELTYQVAQTGEILSVPNTSLQTNSQGNISAWGGALIGLPLKIGQQVVGVMDITYQKPRTFLETELRVMRLLGDQAAIAIENARLFNQAAMERRHLQLLFDVNRAVASSLDYDETLNRAVSLTCQVFGGVLGQAFLYLPEAGRLRLSALYGDGVFERAQFNQHVEVDLGIGLAGWVALHRQAVIVQDVRQDERWYHVNGLDDEICSVICAPIFSGERLFGVLSVLHNQVGVFSNDQLELLQAICHEVGLALSNADQYEQVNRRLAEITLIQNLAQIFSRRLELPVLLDEVVKQLYERFNYPLVEIFLIHEDKLVLQAYRGNSPKVTIQSVNKGVIGRVARSGEVNYIPDVTQDPEYYCCSPDTQAELAVPIFRDDGVVGVINIESYLPDQLTEHDRDLLQVLAGQISVALENAVLYEQVRQHADDLEETVSKRTRELTNLYELSQKIGYTLGYEELMRLVLNHLRSAIGCDISSACLVLGGYKLYYIESSRELANPALDEIHKYSLRGLGRKNEKTKLLDSTPIEMIRADDFNAATGSIENLESLIYVPVILGRKPIGTLIAASEKERPFSNYQVRLLETFAHQAGTAIERIEIIQAAEQKRLEGMVEHLPIGVVLLDADFRLLVANPLAKTILAELDAGMDDGYLSRLGDLSVEDLIYRHREPFPAEIVIGGPPRRVFEVQVRSMGQGSQQRVMTLREVTQEREIQARIQMQDRLATVGQLAAGIAHDFNNIMAAILVYTDLLMGDPNLPKSSRDRLVIIEQQVQRAASLIRQILDFSRRAVMEQSTLDLLPFIKELERMLGRVMPETIRLELAYTSEPYLVNADPTRLQQVFINLAVNARDAMPEGGVLHFSLGRYSLSTDDKPPLPDMQPGEWVKITVRDTGTGIPTDVLPHIFEPFFTTKPVGQGTGLGLAQVYGIIKQHDGHIDVSSRVGQGAEFNIYLPALAEPSYERKHTEPLAPLDGKGKVVMVVEDDPVTLAALQALLESRNYDVITARNGYEAIQQYDRSREDISLVVSDVVMPQMDGVKLYNALMDRSPNTKVLFVTGHPLQGESQALLEGGDVHWLQKPFSAREFTRLVQGLMEA
jgi:PAS domain S-box-containing protein